MNPINYWYQKYRLEKKENMELLSRLAKLTEECNKENKQEQAEVDFEKEFDNYANGILACDVQFEPFTHLHKCAKHFFELGLRTHE